MALQKTISLPNGLSGNYIRIKSAFVINGSSSVNVTVELWKDANTRNSVNSSPIETYSYTAETNGSGDCMTLAYNGLKLLPEYSDAIDV